MNLLVIPAPGAEQAAQVLAAHLQAPLGGVEFRRFPDGESYLRIADDVAQREVILVASLRDPDPQALGLWYLAQTARELGATRVGLVAPYLPYMRQDKRFHPGEAVTSRAFAEFLSRKFDWLATVDPHLHRFGSLDAIYSIPAVAAASACATARWVSTQVERPVIIGPDAESAQWATDVASRVGCPAVVLSKVRLGDRRVEITVPDVTTYRGRTPVVMDDIISSARTMALATAQVRDAFAQPPVCVGVHAIFAPDAMQVLRRAGAGRIVTCNTLPHETNAIDVGPELARAVRQLAGRIK